MQTKNDPQTEPRNVAPGGLENLDALLAELDAKNAADLRRIEAWKEQQLADLAAITAKREAYMNEVTRGQRYTRWLMFGIAVAVHIVLSLLAIDHHWRWMPLPATALLVLASVMIIGSIFRGSEIAFQEAEKRFPFPDASYPLDDDQEIS
jgi:hypothetical protein